MDGGNSGTGWDLLGHDALAAIITLLEPREVASVACTCRAACSVARDNNVWVPLLARYFGLNIQAPDNVRLVSLFRTLYSACKPGIDAGTVSKSTGAAAAASSSWANSTTPRGAVQLKGLYTDGGMDMGDPTFWAGNTFQPNDWSIYCSRAGSNVHCIAQLKAVRTEDPSSSYHRAELISLVSDVAWLLFLGRTHTCRIRQMLTVAEASEATTVPTTTTTRLPSTDSGGGGTLTSVVAGPQAELRALCERLRDTMRSSLRNWSTHGLKQLIWDLMFRYYMLRHYQLRRKQQLTDDNLTARGGDGGGAGRRQRGGEDGKVSDDGLEAWVFQSIPPGLNLDGPAFAVARQLPLPPRLMVMWKDIAQGHNISGKQSLSGLGEDGEGLQVWAQAAGDYLSSPALECTTAVIDGVTISRNGEFTCPVACGALFLAQRGPAAGLQGRSPPAVADEGGGGADNSSELQDFEEELQQRVKKEFEGMVLQPYVQAMSGLTTLEAVEAAAAAGLLPPVVRKGSCPGAGEWLEFGRPSAEAASLVSCLGAPGAFTSTVAAAATSSPGVVASGTYAATTTAAEVGSVAVADLSGAAGGVLWPVVWFRFFPQGATDDVGDHELEFGVPDMLPPVNPYLLPNPDQGMGPPSPDGSWRRLNLNGSSSSFSWQDPDLESDMEVDIAPGGNALPTSGAGAVDRGAAGKSTPDCDGDNDDGIRPTLTGTQDGHSMGVRNSGAEGENQDEGEDGEVINGSITISTESRMLTSSADGTDSDSDFGGDEGGGGPGPGLVNQGLIDWEYELDFLFGIEGLPESYHALRGDMGSNGEGDMAAQVHPYTGAAGAGAGTSKSPFSSTADADGVLPTHPEELSLLTAAGDVGGANGSGVNQNSAAGAGSSMAGANGGGGGAGNVSSSGGGNGCDGIAVYGSAGELLQGVSMRSWLTYISRPNMAAPLLASVAEVAGLQAIRHTFQNVQKELKREAAAADAIVATATATADVAADAINISGVGAGAASAAGASPAAQAPLLVTLHPPAESTEHAFEGLPEVAPLLLPPPPTAPPAHQHQDSPLPTRSPPGHLCMPLLQRWCGNTVLLKLIEPEDCSGVFGEEPDNEPNIDVQFLALRGVTLTLQPPLRLTACGGGGGGGGGGNADGAPQMGAGLL